LEHQA
jgi:hypothetical protein